MLPRIWDTTTRYLMGGKYNRRAKTREGKKQTEKYNIKKMFPTNEAFHLRNYPTREAYPGKLLYYNTTFLVKCVGHGIIYQIVYFLDLRFEGEVWISSRKDELPRTRVCVDSHRSMPPHSVNRNSAQRGKQQA